MQDKPKYLDSDEYLTRKNKLDEIRALGVEAYPHVFKNTHSLCDFKDSSSFTIGNFKEASEGESGEVKVAGRIVLMRAMGKNIFVTIQHDGSRLQVLFNRDKTKVKGYKESEGSPTHHKFLQKKLDLGDYIGCLLYTSPSPRDGLLSRMPSSA